MISVFHILRYIKGIFFSFNQIMWLGAETFFEAFLCGASPPADPSLNHKSIYRGLEHTYWPTRDSGWLRFVITWRVRDEIAVQAAFTPTRCIFPKTVLLFWTILVVHCFAPHTEATVNYKVCRLIVNLNVLIFFFFFCSTTTRGGFWPSLQAYSTPFYF
jgi:hypothetical protein